MRVLLCLDKWSSTENVSSWIREYDVSQDLFHFGGRTFSRKENVGYFFDNAQILCYRRNGELVNKWDTLGQMLFDEIEIVEQMMLERVPATIKLKVS